VTRGAADGEQRLPGGDLLTGAGIGSDTLGGRDRGVQGTYDEQREHQQQGLGCRVSPSR
jgi:hypothetical protein